MYYFQILYTAPPVGRLPGIYSIIYKINKVNAKH